MRHLVLLLLMLVTACATTGSSDDVVAIETRARGQELAGAACNVSTNAGNWNVVTPGSVKVGSSSGDLRVVCNKDGYRTSEVIYRPSSPLGSSVGVGASGGSGNVGLGVGVNFPLSLGGGRYPSHVTVDLNPQ